MNQRSLRCAFPLALAAALTTQIVAAPAAAPLSMSNDCPPSPSRVLRLYVINEAAASSQTLGTAAVEATAIWATAGLSLKWTFPPSPLVNNNQTVIVMIERRLKRPSTPGAVASSAPAMPLLGQIPFGEDGPGNLIQVSFEAITSLVIGGSYLNNSVAKLPEFLQQVLLGRALGRVLAHEIGHWRAGRGHIRAGLMKPAFAARDLLEWNSPQLPRAWTTEDSDIVAARSSRCEATAPVR